jgi:hypothetical protein
MHSCYEDEDGNVKTEPEQYCTKIDRLIPCLDSTLKNREYKDSDLMSIRALKDH